MIPSKIVMKKCGSAYQVIKIVDAFCISLKVTDIEVGDNLAKSIAKDLVEHIKEKFPLCEVVMVSAEFHTTEFHVIC